jgi:glycosyltransferase 2 family protein
MSVRPSLAFWAKVVVTGAMLGAVLARVNLANLAATLSTVKWPLFLAALGIALPTGFTGVQRWRTVAATFGESLPLSKAFVYAWIGQFINLGLPTVLGLDSVRAWKMHQQGLSLGLAARIVIVDRLCSLVSLLLIIAIGLPRLAGLDGSAIFKHAAVVAFALGSAGLAFLFAFRFWGHVLPNLALVRHLYQLSKNLNHALLGNRTLTLAIVFWGTLNHLCRIATVLCVALALRLSLSPLDAFTLVPSALLIAMVPITLAGWGVREAVFIQAFSLAGLAPSQALALSILYGFIGLATGLLGGGVWLAEQKLQKPEVKPAPSERQALAKNSSTSGL